jgi:hypothetical protein
MQYAAMSRAATMTSFGLPFIDHPKVAPAMFLQAVGPVKLALPASATFTALLR